MKKGFMQILAVCLCICLLPVSILAEELEKVNDGTPVTHSDLELSFRLYADGFPDDGNMHYQDWEEYVSRISLRGSLDTQSFPSPYDRIFFDGAFHMDDNPAFPFIYDGYYSFRYLTSPALNGESIHMQMFNFFQFMLKPYYYMYMPTQYAALVLYPEAAVEMWQKYMEPVQAAVCGEGNRTVGYQALSELAQQLNDIVLNDVNWKAYYFFTCLLTDLGMDWTAMDKLESWDALLAYLDPGERGMKVETTDDGERWIIGETAVYQKKASGQETVYTVTLPDPDGYVFSVEIRKAPSEAHLQLMILLENEEYFILNAGIDGLPAEGQISAQGSAWAEFSGSVLNEEIPPVRFSYDYSRTADQKPYDLNLTVNAIHHETGKPCLGVVYRAAVEERPHTALVERPYNFQDDFFHLNEYVMEEYKQRYLPTLALAAAPFLLNMPAGVISDVIAYMNETGLLAYLGIE